jgi:CTP:molybdopterin cytidylyltransferase MocA
MTIAAISPSDQLCQRYGLRPDVARAVVRRFGHQADDHCSAVARRLRNEIRRLAGHPVHASNDIPALVHTKGELVESLMTPAPRQPPHLQLRPRERTGVIFN